MFIDVPVIKFKLSMDSTTTLNSKLGGVPYFPENAEIPKDEFGREMYVLAQINFEELPNVFPDWPKQGILQVWASFNDGPYGLSFCKQPLHQAIFFENPSIEKHSLDLNVSYTEDEQDFLPFNEDNPGIKMTFREGVSVKWDAMPVAYAYDILDGIEGDNRDKVIEEYEEKDPYPRHSLGGYCSFVQCVQPEIKERLNDHTLLLQIEYDYNIDDTNYCVGFGDGGIWRLSTPTEDLTANPPRFDRTVVDWDCG